MDIADMDEDIRRSRVIAKDLLKTHNSVASVIVSHSIIIVNKVNMLETRIELLPIKHFYKQTGEATSDDSPLIEEVMESKVY